MSASVNIYGPQGCGKSRVSENLRLHYGLDEVIDEGEQAIKSTNPEGVLYITVDPLPVKLRKGMALVLFTDVKTRFLGKPAKRYVAPAATPLYREKK